MGKMGWSTEKVAKVADVLRPEYMSSEESEVDDEDTTCAVKRYLVHSLPWESSSLKKIKRKLDKSHKKSLNGLVTRLRKPREVGQPSRREMPANCPEWAMKSTVPEPAEELNTSIDSVEAYDR